MTSRRKAELQRKLALTSVPKPPDDLAERIKRGIPDSLFDGRRERDRLARSVGRNLRVAASILLLVTSALVAVHLLSRDRVEVPLAAVPEKLPAKAASPTADAAGAPPPHQSRGDAAAAPQIAEAKPRPSSKTEESVRSRDAEPDRAAIAGIGRDQRDNEVAVAQDAIRTEARSIAERTVAMAPPPAAAAVPATPPAERGVEGGVEGGVVGGVVDNPSVARDVPARQIAKVAASAESARLFGVAIDRGAFEVVKAAIERGERPSPSSVDVGALVNYFAGAPKRVRRDVEMEVEGSATPVGSDAWEWIVRITVDTARGAQPEVVATNARIDLDFDEHAVVAWERAGGERPLPMTQPLLARNASVTLLHEVRLRANLRPMQRVATVTLTWTPAGGGKEKVVGATLRVKDFKRW
ncbi:MAG TPA: hypothetical protein VNL91_07005, partial [Thermoanaerobaculia bacterium]|nr:hypothetical protein [Thermoanaerobaculia bacterium]